MKRKLSFVGHILVFNVIRLLPHSSSYFNRHFRLPHILFQYESHYRVIVHSGKVRLGWPGIFLANIALLFFCLPLCFSADLVIHAVRLLSIKIAVNAILALVLLVKFDLLRLRDERNYLKLFYLFSCFLSSSYWTLTCMFLAAFENIML